MKLLKAVIGIFKGSLFSESINKRRCRRCRTAKKRSSNREPRASLRPFISFCHRRVKRKKDRIPSREVREIIADNLNKAGWNWAVCQPWILLRWLFTWWQLSFLNRSEEATVPSIREILRSAEDDRVPAFPGQIILQLPMAL